MATHTVEQAQRRDELGRLAYATYGDAVNWLSYGGDLMPDWTEVRDSIRAAWIEAAATAYRRGHADATSGRESDVG